jgi:hypothetical protein
MACQAYGCLTRQGYGKSLFCFPDPVKKKELYLTWMTNLSIEESFTCNEHKLVCEDHFETSCFEGNLMVILFIFLIILNIWIYYTITFCRFTFCFYWLWQNKWIGGRGSSLMNTFTKDFFPNLKNYEIKLKKERTSEQCLEFVKKKSKKAYTTGQNCFNDIIQ